MSGPPDAFSSWNVPTLPHAFLEDIIRHDIAQAASARKASILCPCLYPCWVLLASNFLELFCNLPTINKEIIKITKILGVNTVMVVAKDNLKNSWH